MMYILQSQDFTLYISSLGSTWVGRGGCVKSLLDSLAKGDKSVSIYKKKTLLMCLEVPYAFNDLCQLLVKKIIKKGC
jgi:hypothetical protein